MNRFKNYCVTAMLMLISQMSNAQHYYPAAITKNGILFGKYITANDATNPLPDTISLEDAKNIIAINAIHIDKEQKLYRVKVAEYQMTVHEKADTATIKNNSEMLSLEMKERLHKIKSGAKLFFEGIRIKFPNGESRFVIILSFTVI